MKMCQQCGQLLAEEIPTCPSCGSVVREGRQSIDDYRILDVLHEGYSSILCRAVKAGEDTPVMLRIFTPESGVDGAIAERLKRELETLHQLPEHYFVRHLEIRQSSDGLWYRVSEWLDAQNWGNLIASGLFQDYRIAFGLFYRVASILEGLHQIGHFIPHLILEDILVLQGDREELQVKIDYKLSRFLDPKMDRPGPALKRLLAVHPDIIHHRPLDFRSDIWSLGKIFVELLAAEHEIEDYSAKIDELCLPPTVEILLRAMISEDPALRPQSMAEVANGLSQVDEADIERATRARREAPGAPVAAIRSLRRRTSLLLVLILLVLGGGLAAWIFLFKHPQDSETAFREYVNRYAGSVAFVVAEYWLQEGETTLYRNITEGTAFLVDPAGYLLTNRHVACPWLEDSQLYLIINSLTQARRTPRFGYRLFLWFEGSRAFKRLPGVTPDADLEEFYFLDSAFRSDGNPRLAIAGVARAPEGIRQLIKSPLKDDFAILKIDAVPENLHPLPLDTKMVSLNIPKLSPVITLGFPLGRRIQESTVNVSVTRGNVRRTFENLIQVDTSIHRGNSGGPIIDSRGKVIGIASGVATDRAIGPLPMTTLLPDIGMVLPITKAVVLLEDLKSGHIKWNGVLDLSVGAKMKKILRLAGEGRWAEAEAQADQELQDSYDPALVLTAGLMHFCTGDYPGGGRLFERALSVDDTHIFARWMLFLIGWMEDRSAAGTVRRELSALDWRSPHAFYGYLVNVLEGEGDSDAALTAGCTAEEAVWLQYGVGMRSIKRGEVHKAEALFRQVLIATDTENRLYILALAALETLERQTLATLAAGEAREAYRTVGALFKQELQHGRTAKAEHQALLAPLVARLNQGALDLEDKRALLEQILELDPRNGELLARLVFYNAMDSLWEPAMAAAQRFLSTGCRENHGRLQVGLLVPEILNRLGRGEEARAELAAYRDRTHDSWYRAIAESLLDEQAAASLVERAGESPAYVVTMHVALGLWAEGAGDTRGAIRHYQEALGSYLDDMIEYEFALERIQRLKKTPES